MALNQNVIAMKRLCLIGLILIFVVSCKDDDDQIIAECETPTNLSISEITDISAVLNWENLNDNQDVKVEYGLTGFLPGNGTIISSSESSTSINGLIPNTAYEFYVQALCSVENISMESEVSSFNTDVSPVIPEFLTNLSEMNLFIGDIKDLNFSPNTFKYELSTPLYTDYAKKQRIISLPIGTSMEYNGDGLPLFPDGAVMAKTFYYNYDETNLDLGRKIIETRVLIRQSNLWYLGNYLWSEDQSDATLDTESHIIPINWINEFGEEMSTDYEVPDSGSCFTCHQNSDNTIPIGPKLRSMNFDVNGSNQLLTFISDGHLNDATNPIIIGELPDWEDTSYSEQDRTKAYFDMNCAHCHSPGGYYNTNYTGTMDLRFETSFEDSQIFEKRVSILTRFSTSIPGYSMPFIGVSMPHQEAIDMIIPYLESLE